MKIYLFFISLILLLNTYQLNDKPNDIVLTATKREKITDECFKITDKYLIQEGVYIECSSVSFPCRNQYANEKNMEYIHLNIHFRKKNIDLKKFYLSKILNKKIKYLPGFISGNYTKHNKKLKIKLEFLNELLNSSASTSHTYYIEYDLKKMKLNKLDLTFDEE